MHELSIMTLSLEIKCYIFIQLKKNLSRIRGYLAKRLSIHGCQQSLDTNKSEAKQLSFSFLSFLLFQISFNKDDFSLWFCLYSKPNPNASVSFTQQFNWLSSKSKTNNAFKRNLEAAFAEATIFVKKIISVKFFWWIFCLQLYTKASIKEELWSIWKWSTSQSCFESSTSIHFQCNYKVFFFLGLVHSFATVRLKRRKKKWNFSCYLLLHPKTKLSKNNWVLAVHELANRDGSRIFI